MFVALGSVAFSVYQHGLCGVRELHLSARPRNHHAARHRHGIGESFNAQSLRCCAAKAQILCYKLGKVVCVACTQLITQPSVHPFKFARDRQRTFTGLFSNNKTVLSIHWQHEAVTLHLVCLLLANPRPLGLTTLQLECRRFGFKCCQFRFNIKLAALGFFWMRLQKNKTLSGTSVRFAKCWKSGSCKNSTAASFQLELSLTERFQSVRHERRRLYLWSGVRILHSKLSGNRLLRNSRQRPVSEVCTFISRCRLIANQRLRLVSLRTLPTAPAINSKCPNSTDLMNRASQCCSKHTVLKPRQRQKELAALLT